MEERKLIEGCVRGEPLAQKAMYELYASAMMSLCQRYAGNCETARDLMHDGFVKMFTKIHTYSGTGSFKGWIKRIFVTTALEHLRRKDALRYSAEIEDVEYQIEDDNISVFEQLSADELLACIAQLPEGYRTVFNLHAIEGYTHVEIAEALGINEGTSRSQYARARQVLRKLVMSYRQCGRGCGGKQRENDSNSS
ncbi:MAG: sigma-70 family RNA polymerase sigma factor [Bacteroidales bacterium]|nr:sigma-70 family RNA polymerase sigma factor [Bacteroidales bacterium]MCL2133887.1 sigma-70 family RNA polymerase sigma factor [Bacteroidales bacterium]